jgi:4-amino-4-deoxy-L-arabinose transferase-like glycosyltransferase
MLPMLRPKWLAVFAALLTPLPGPHIDQYVAVGWVLLRAAGEDADAGFWILAGAILVLGYAAWFLLFTGIAWLWRRRRKRETPPSR